MIERDIVTRLRALANALLVAEIETLREERDEARRLVCRHTKKTYRTLRETAEERGWDCFKEKP